MKKSARNQNSLLVFSKKFRLIFILVLILITIASLYVNLPRKVKAADLVYIEDFTTTIYKDEANTTGKWDKILTQARLLGKDWVNMAETKDGYENVSNTSSSSHYQIVIDTNDNPHVLFSSSYGLYFTKWTPGTGWTKMDGTIGQDLISNSWAYSTELKIDNINNPYIAWIGADRDVYFTKWSGTNWIKMDGSIGSDNISNTALAQNYVSLELDSAFNPYVAWRDITTTDIYFSRWNGIAWTKMDGITPGYDNVSNGAGIYGTFRLKRDNTLPNNIPYIIWYNSSSIYLSKYTFGTGWTKMNGIIGHDTISTTGQNNIEFAIGTNNFPYIVWEDTPGTTQVRFTRWSGANWVKMSGALGYDVVSAPLSPSTEPDIILDSSNNPYVVWKGMSLGLFGTYFSKWTPAPTSAWTKMSGALGNENIGSGLSMGQFPKIDLDSVFNPNVTWVEQLTDNIYFTKWSLATGWKGMYGTAYDLLTPDFGSVIYNNILLNSLNIPYVSWAGYSAGNLPWDVYFTKWLGTYKNSSIIQSLKINPASYNSITKATLTTTQTDSPPNQTIDYYLSNDGGNTWESVSLGVEHTFTSKGGDLRWKAVLTTTNINVTPIIDDLSISYTGFSLEFLPQPPPSAPTGFFCTALSTDIIRWSFADTATDETGFRLYEAEEKILDTGDYITTDLDHFDEVNLQTNTLYANRYVKTFNGVGESSPSNTVSCYTLANTPIEPKLLNISENSINLILDYSDNNPPNTEYAIKELTTEKYIDANGLFVDTETWQTYQNWGGDKGINIFGYSLAFPNTNTNQDSTHFNIALTSGTSYQFVIKARNGDGIETVFSPALSVSTSVILPIPVTNYACNFRTGTCSVADTGSYTSLSDCQAKCVVPVSMKYTCNSTTGVCTLSTVGKYSTLSDCRSVCFAPPINININVPPTVLKYSCDSATGSCFEDSNGSYSSLSACQSACTIIPININVPLGQARYSCDAQRGSCYSDTSGVFTNLSDCQSSCKIIPPLPLITLPIISSSVSFRISKIATNYITPVLLAVAAVNTIPTAIILIAYLLPYLHLLFIEPLLFLFKRKRKKWGIVYNSLSKVPVDLAVVRLYRKLDKKLIQTRVTDSQGRYIMIVKEKGDYYLSVIKSGFAFPTRYLSSEKQDAKYLDLYHGEAIFVTEKDATITANIPLDPAEKKVMSERTVIFGYIFQNLRVITAYLGTILAALIFLIYPSWITGLAILVHLLLLVIFIRLIVPKKPRSWGIIYDQRSKKPLHYAVVRIFDLKFNKLLETQVTDGKGRYSFLVGQNQYQLLAEKVGYAKKEIKPVDLIAKEEIINLDVGLMHS